MPERILDVTGVTKRFQTTIPKLVREIMNISDEIFKISNGEAKVEKA